MKTRRCLIVGCALAILAGLIAGQSAPSSLADFPTSEHYRLAASEVEIPSMLSASQVLNQGSEHYRLAAAGTGDVPVAIQSESYMVNEGVVLQAEVAPPAESENYQSGGEIPQKVYLPLVLRDSE
jgi:hypothetical protein